MMSAFDPLEKLEIAESGHARPPVSGHRTTRSGPFSPIVALLAGDSSSGALTALVAEWNPMRSTDARGSAKESSK
jgi:hypothetical protein